MAQESILVVYWGRLFETREQRLERLYEENRKATQIAIRKMARENANLLASIDREKRNAKREYQQHGKAALLASAQNIALLQRAFEHGVWAKCRLERILVDTRIAKGQTDIVNTMAMATRAAVVMAGDANFERNLMALKREGEKMQFAAFQFNEMMALTEEDIYDDDDAAVDQIMLELQVSVGANSQAEPVVPSPPESPETAQTIAAEVQLAALPPIDRTPIELERRLEKLKQ